MNEYIIINKTAIEKRIELLEKTNQIQRVDELENVLSQSTPLIPEIEKAYNWGYTQCEEGDMQDPYDCITNLKLDI